MKPFKAPRLLADLAFDVEASLADAS